MTTTRQLLAASKLARWRMRAHPVTPTLQIHRPTNLEEHGVDAVVLPVPGHTAGSCAILTADGDAVVGGVVSGGFALGRCLPRHPLRHYFADDVQGVRRGLGTILSRNPERLFVGHGGPSVSTEAVRRRLENIAPPR